MFGKIKKSGLIAAFSLFHEKLSRKNIIRWSCRATPEE